jgi:hypothetical protein
MLVKVAEGAQHRLKAPNDCMSDMNDLAYPAAQCAAAVKGCYPLH